MSASAPAETPPRHAAFFAFPAVRARFGLVALLLTLAAVGWWWTVEQMRGMDNGPWTGLGGVAWFLAVWAVMMAAMMFPSVAPTIALYSRMTGRRSPRLPLLFACGYLITWTIAGVIAYAVGAAGNTLDSGFFTWGRAGRWTAGGVLVVAAAYELTPLKDRCLGKCRSPLGLLLSSWRDGSVGALRMGAKNGAWCVACCWALMAALFALGVMSVVWMAVVAGLIAFEKLVPWPRIASYGTAAVLVTLGLLVLTAPGALPGLTTPSNAPMQPMTSMQP